MGRVIIQSGLAHEIASAVAQKPRQKCRRLFEFLGFSLYIFKAAVFAAERRALIFFYMAVDKFSVLHQALVGTIAHVIATHTDGPEIQIRQLRHWRRLVFRL